MNGPAVIRAILVLLIVAIIGMLLYWLIGYLAALWGFPAIVTKAAYSILVVVGVLFLIDALLQVIGRGFIRW